MFHLLFRPETAFYRFIHLSLIIKMDARNLFFFFFFFFFSFSSFCLLLFCNFPRHSLVKHFLQIRCQIFTEYLTRNGKIWIRFFIFFWKKKKTSVDSHNFQTAISLIISYLFIDCFEFSSQMQHFLIRLMASDFSAVFKWRSASNVVSKWIFISNLLADIDQLLLK